MNKDMTMTEAEGLEITTMRIHHLANVIAHYFSDEKPSPADIANLDDEVYDLLPDELRIDEAWELYTHRPVKRSGGTTVHKAELPSDELTGDLLEEALLTHFYQRGISVDKAPKVSDLKAAGFTHTSAHTRDKVWSVYTLEKQVEAKKDQASDATDNLETSTEE